LSTFPAEEIAQLRQVVQSGRAVLGGRLIGEEAFFVAMGKLKKSLTFLRSTPICTSPSGEPIHFHKLFDEMEQYVENGKMHFFGLVWIQPAPLLEKINILEFLLQHGEFAPVDTTDASHKPHEITSVENLPDEPEQLVENAKAEAERIIFEAKQEAERIKEEARRKAEQPWLTEPRDG
jgi:hypothetical protein